MDKLNLTPQERRLVAGVGLIVFGFLNVWLVWPHFSDWRTVQADRAKAERTTADYQKEIDRLKLYQAKVRDLESQGSSVEAEEQDIDLATVVRTHSLSSKLEITDNRDVRSSSTQTNQFFDEKARKIQYHGDTEALVSFLTNLTQASSLIRVKDLTVHPEPPNAPTRLSGDITLVASYQKKAPASAVAVASASPGKAATSSPTARPPIPTRKTAATSIPAPASTTTPTNKSLTASNTNRMLVPKPKPIVPSLPKS